MKTSEIFISTVGGEEKHFFSKKECEDYELSLKDFLILKFIVSRMTPNENKYVNMGVVSKIERISSSTSFRVTKDLKIIQYHTTYDNWDGRPPINSINNLTVDQYLTHYSRSVLNFKDSLIDCKDDLIKLKSIKYESEKLDKVINCLKKEIKDIEEAVTFLNRYNFNDENNVLNELL